MFLPWGAYRGTKAWGATNKGPRAGGAHNVCKRSTIAQTQPPPYISSFSERVDEHKTTLHWFHTERNPLDGAPSARTDGGNKKAEPLLLVDQKNPSLQRLAWSWRVAPSNGTRCTARSARTGGANKSRTIFLIDPSKIRACRGWLGPGGDPPGCCGGGGRHTRSWGWGRPRRRR